MLPKRKERKIGKGRKEISERKKRKVKKKRKKRKSRKGRGVRKRRRESRTQKRQRKELLANRELIQIKPSQMEVAPLHRTFVISHKRRLSKNTKEI